MLHGPCSFQELHDRAVQQYSSESWQDAIVLFQLVLDSYYEEHRKCEALCEDHLMVLTNQKYDQIIGKKCGRPDLLQFSRFSSSLE